MVEPAPIETAVSVAPSALTETEPTQAKSMVATALSPYAVYDRFTNFAYIEWSIL